MKKYIGFFIGGAILICMIVFSVVIINTPTNHAIELGDSAETIGFGREDILSLAANIDFDNYNPESIIPADANSGNLPEKIKGNQDAKVIIYEYADYACSHCADANTVVNKIIKDYDGQVALVFRGYILKGFPNNVETAAAANAAAIQGYWDEYKNLLFSNQATWYYLDSDEIVPYLGQLFSEASNEQGDLEQFYTDIKSEAIARRIAFDYGLGQKIELSGTPHFRINGEAVTASNLRDKIDELLNK